MFDGNANARLYNPAVISVGSGRLLMYARVSTVTHQTFHLVLLPLRAVSGCCAALSEGSYARCAAIVTGAYVLFVTEHVQPNAI